MGLKVKGLVVQLCSILCNPMDYTVCQAPLSMGCPRQEDRSGLPFPSPEDLPNPRIKPKSPELADRFITTKPPAKP